MARPGPKPKFEATDAASRAPKPATGIPDCPPHLDKVAREEWDRVAATMHATGTLTHLDRSALAAYCTAYSRWVDAETKLRELGPVIKAPSGFPVQNPYLPIANKALDLMKKFACELGLTPSARSTIKVPIQREESEEDRRMFNRREYEDGDYPKLTGT